MHKHRIVLADDHELVLEGLRSLVEAEPDLHVAATATNGKQVLEAVRAHAPEVVVLDLEMGEMNGLRCLEILKRDHPAVRVLILTAYGDGESMRAALEGGADGFALKTEPPQQTVTCIRQVCRGQLVFPLAARKWLLRGDPVQDAHAHRPRDGDPGAGVGGPDQRADRPPPARK